VYSGRCSDSQTAAGVTLVSTDVQSNQCSYSIPVTFYIPSFNYGYREVLKYCYDDGSGIENPNIVCDPLPSNTQRYRAPNFGESGYMDPEYYLPVGYDCLISDPQGMFAKIDTTYVQRCSRIQIAYEQGSITEGNEIAVYRFSAPVSQFQNSSGVVDNNALGQWFMGLSSQIGSGWTAASYFTGGSDNSLAVLDYSQACQGNVCTITDNVNVPQDSYVVYAAKILGSYSWLETVVYGAGENEEIRTTYPVKQNKFLSKINLGNGVLASLPEGASIGNAYLGPFKTGIIPADCGLNNCGRCSTIYKYTWANFITDSPTCNASAIPIPDTTVSYGKSCACVGGTATYNSTWDTECSTVTITTSTPPGPGPGPVCSPGSNCDIVIITPTSTPGICQYGTCPPIPIELQTPSCSLTANPSNLLPPQSTTTISWACQRADTCYLGVSSLPVGYSTSVNFCSAVSGTMGNNYCKVNNQQFTKNLSLKKGTDFTLNCSNPNGSTIITNTVKVAEPHLIEVNPQ